MRRKGKPFRMARCDIEHRGKNIVVYTTGDEAEMRRVLLPDARIRRFSR